jgi:hypothetical protein
MKVHLWVSGLFLGGVAHLARYIPAGFARPTQFVPAVLVLSKFRCQLGKFTWLAVFLIHVWAIALRIRFTYFLALFLTLRKWSHVAHQCSKLARLRQPHGPFL